MRAMFKVSFVLFMFACVGKPGDFEQNCKPDGTCNSPELVCARTSSNTSLCTTKNFANLTNNTYQPYVQDAIKFCERCAYLCLTTGINKCQHSDITTWGSSPIICECK